MRSLIRPLALVALLASLPTFASAQTLVGRNDSVFTWHGAIGANGRVVVKNYNGPIDVRPSTGAEVELRAEKRTERGGGVITDVAFDIDTRGDVTICSTYRDNNPCDNERDRNRDRDRDRYDDGWRRSVTVSMTLMVPKGVQVHVSTGNGAVSVERVTGDVQATTGNGKVRVLATEGPVRVSTGNGDVDVRESKASVRVTTGNGRVTIGTVEGPVEARSGNGDIDVTMTKLKSREDMSFSTGSGDVRVTLPAGYNGDLEATTGNGELRSDFDLKVQGRMNPNRVRATIGEGGARLRMTTGNGRIDLRKQ